MDKVLLNVENLNVRYHCQQVPFHAVKNVNFVLKKGQSIGIIGESGSGKTSLAMAIMGILPKSAEVNGSISLNGVDLVAMDEKDKVGYRWRRVAMVFQNSLDVLNPVMTVAEQIYECIARHMSFIPTVCVDRVNELLVMVGLQPEQGGYYPHQLSGGMRQRILLAMALSCDPEVVIVDEPATALDATAKNEVIRLLSKLQAEKGFGMLVISHELPAIMELTTEIMVMYAGNIMEHGLTQEVLTLPFHPYTRGLLSASPSINPFRDLWGIPGEADYETSGCSFASRCSQSIDCCLIEKPFLKEVAENRKIACNRNGIVTLLEARGIEKYYQQQEKKIAACDGCGLRIRWGEIVVLIGESGSGKTTLAGIIAGIQQANEGSVWFEGKTVTGNQATARKQGIQIVFQDPFSAINEHFTVEEAVREPLDILQQGAKKVRQESVIKALQDVQLGHDEVFRTKKCYMLSGGQRQRVALARSLVMEPKLLIADEISSMLDPSTQANILRLLKGLQYEKGFAMLYITHDLATAQKIADYVYVMRKGKMVEEGVAWQVFAAPRHEYTQQLLQETKSNQYIIKKANRT